MALALVRGSIEADQGGTPHARARVSLVSWEGRSHALLFMVPLGLPSARPMAQALRLPFEYYIIMCKVPFPRGCHIPVLHGYHIAGDLVPGVPKRMGVPNHRDSGNALVGHHSIVPNGLNPDSLDAHSIWIRFNAQNVKRP